MWQGILTSSPGWIAVYVLAATHVTIASVTIYLHRHQAHRALDLHPWVAHGFRFWLWLTTGMVTREWVAVHRKHHARCETEEDPHSPQVRGIAQVLWRGAELYRTAAARPQVLERYGKGTPDDWLERRIYSAHNLLGVSLLLVLDAALFGPLGVTAWAVQMVWIPLFAAGVINGVGHYLGYRRFFCPDASTNILPWGVLIGGEELHNNHHAYPGSARLSARWWELDIGWVYIRILAALGLARVRKVAPRPLRLPGAGARGGEAMGPLVGHRLQIVAGYGREVLGRLLRRELRRSADKELRLRLKPLNRLFQWDETMLNGEALRCLERGLASSEALRIAYQFRQRLVGIWQQAGALSPERLQQALREWCAEAEDSGIDYLAQFSRRLGYFAGPSSS